MKTTIQKLTFRQQEVLALIEAFQNQHGYPPTRKEVAQLMGATSPNAAGDMLRSLQRRGAITLVKGVARGITIKTQRAENEAIALLRAMVNGDASAQQRAIVFIHSHGGAQ